MFTDSEKNTLLDLARSTIESSLKTGKVPGFSTNDKALVQRSGAFVTLHKNGELRGCIGKLISDDPLYVTVMEMAKEAAFDDPRFTALTNDELSKIKIEISVLSPMKKIKDITEIKLGKHGVLIKKGPYSGVFLPQVATETGWTLEQFMDNLCAGKAGLPADAWRKGNADIYIFTVEIISE